VEAIHSTEAKVKSIVDHLFGLEGTAGTSDINTSDAVAESTFVLQHGCNATSAGKSSEGDNQTDSTGKPVGLSTVTLDAAAQMACTIQGSTHPGVRQTALLKHYRWVRAIRPVLLYGLKSGMWNSFLFPSLSNEVQVPEEVFLTLHAMQTTALSLERHCLHAAINLAHRQRVSKIISHFRNKQPSLVEDKIARNLVNAELQLALDETVYIIGRYSLHSAMKDALQLQPAKEVKGNARHPRWEYGINPRTLSNKGSKSSAGECQSVDIPGDCNAQQVLLVAKVQMKAGAVNLRFSFGSRSQADSGMGNEYICDNHVTVVGWTLSCDNGWGELARFKCSGGIGERWLSITAWAPRGREWHCRVTFVTDMDALPEANMSGRWEDETWSNLDKSIVRSINTEGGFSYTTIQFLYLKFKRWNEKISYTPVGI
jgi:hypothetical protein